MSRRVAVAMSGGVDSSVAAALMQKRGREPFGITMRLFAPDSGVARLPAAERTGRCCGGEDVEVARAAAHVLDMPFFVLDFEEDFRRLVVTEFVRAYRRGRTPLPCANCNHSIKFDRLLSRARGLGAERLITGHYARSDRDPGTGRWRLRRAGDADKDQSYFLFGLTQEMLEQVEFPLGGLTKSLVRTLAGHWRLPNADKAESQDLCFVPDGDYRGFVERMGERPEVGGEVVDGAGRTLGHHTGLSRFTVGQRRGLGLSGGRRMYVVALEPERRRVVVGNREETACSELIAGPVNWVSRPRPARPLELLVQVRHRHRPVAARVEPDSGGRVRVTFERPVLAPAPGQAAVFYDGDLVAGGGWIASTVPASGRVAHAG